MEIETQNARFKLHQNHAKVEIETELPKSRLTSMKLLQAPGLKTIWIWQGNSAKGRQNALRYIGKVADDGDALAAIENGGNLIPELAKRDSYKTHEFNIDAIPKASPKVSVSGGLEIDFPQDYRRIIHNGVEGILFRRILI